MIYLGDYPVNGIVDFKWNTNAVAGESITRATNGSIRVYKNNSTAERASAAGITDTEDFDTMTGIHHCRIDLSDNTDAGFYAAGNDYQVVLFGATIDGKAINAVLAHFSIENRNIKANVVQMANDVITAAVLAATAIAEIRDSILSDSTPFQGARIDAAISSRASQASVDTVAGYVDTEVAAIKAQTDKLTFDAGNRVASNLKAIDDATASATNLRRSTDVLYVGSVTGAATATTLIDSGLTQAAADHWKGRVIIFVTGTLRYQGATITAFDPATDQLTFDAMTGAPAGGDVYIIV